MENNNTYNIHNSSVITGRYYKSEIIRYDEPVLALMGNKIGEIHGMILTVTAYEDKGHDRIYTYRTPLVGRELESAGNFSESAYYEKFYLLPDDRKLSPSFFKKLVTDYTANEYNSFSSLVHSLNEHHCVVQLDDNDRQIVCNTGRSKNVIFVECPYFDLYFRYKGKCDALHPTIIEDLYHMQEYLGRQLIFHEPTSKFGEEGDWERILNLRMSAYHQNGLFGIEQRDENYRSVGHIYNDGINSYMFGKEVIPMSREEFMKIYPSATQVWV